MKDDACTSILVGKKAAMDGNNLIARNDDNLQRAILLGRPTQEAIKKALRKSRRIGRVENITRNQEHIGSLGDKLPAQPRKKGFMLVMAFIGIKRLTQMPIGRMQNFQCHR